ncbi:hypothetical protein P3X46_013238 [Hevea brasiliensis]|uniref:Uncharacterized protein n=1 Tax=Hevea brasiliensis TaxID=3981 RepID=A0ABQ9M3Z9_HEVBR|nr:uncharacterized protein LOC131182219 [Hevea brasiliensis]KAJ9174603.1 hypothetical protein P3X46_013238 [Hevea brasiliensis]
MPTTISDQDKTLERIFLITNLVVELPSAVLDQLASVHKPRYALISLIMSFVIMLISALDLVRIGRRGRVKWMRRGKIIPWFYSSYPSYKPLGKFADIVGLVCSIFQCASAAIAYAFVSHKADTPIKISVWPLIFAFGVLCSRFPKNPRPEIHLESPARRTLHELQPSETQLYYEDKKNYREFSETPKKSNRKKREEVERLKQLHTLKGHVESVAKLKELDIDSDEQYYSV